ncbi:biopolymer transporter ExbD [Algimonas ampicilliniresistens]|uniref:Biopolymer transporter ExbD n=2 Tax=Algimonas ampicilliniresistens TaxID=1298735 RepID=A0ABQ5V984_9PROT|nr:biopolymer transporter ExbD [Algimonas ampicilliniresistens]
MRRQLRRREDEAAVDMTPMLDLVFIMLIFFIVSAVFLNESGLALAETPNTNPPGSSVQTILVQLDALDGAFIDGTRVNLIAIPSRVQTLRAQAPEAIVSVHAQSGTSVDAVVFLKDQMDAASIPVSIKVQK